MTNFAYTEGLPNPPDRPNQDVARMQINTNSVFGIVGQDHIGFGQDNGGYHTVIHSIPTNTPTAVYTDMLGDAPTNISGVEQVFPLLYKPDTNPASAADTQLFARTGSGTGITGISQLTGNNASANGWCWTGGILLQWGFAAVTTTGGGTITFQSATGIPFPRNCFVVNATIQGSISASNPSIVTIGTLSLANFTYAFFKGTGSTTGFYWFAVGN